MGLQRIIKASSGAQLSPSKIKLKLGDREEDITLDDARNAYIANPLAYKDTKDKELTEKALQIALDGLRNGTIQGTPGVDSLGNFTISGSADIFNLSRDPEQKKLFKRVNQVVGNIAMQRYNSYKAPEVKEEKKEKKEGYDYDTRAKTRGLQYSFFRNNADAAYQLNHLTGKYQSGKAYNGAMYDTEDKRMAQVDKYFRDIYDNEVLNKDFDSSRFGYNKDEFSKLYGEYNMEGLAPEQKREKAASLAMILGEGSNYSKIFSPLEYLQQATTEGSAGSAGYGVEGETPKQEYTDLGNGMYSTQKDGKTYIGTKQGDEFTPVTNEGTYGGYVVGSDGALVRSQIPEINDFYSAAEFSKNPYMIFNGKKMFANTPEYTNMFANMDPKSWIENNKESIYGKTTPSDEMIKQDVEQLTLFNNKEYFNKPIQELEQVAKGDADRKLKLVDTKGNAANEVNKALNNSAKQSVYDVSDYFQDDDNSYFFTYKVNEKGTKVRTLVKGKRDGNKITDLEEIPMNSDKLKDLPFAKNKGEFSKREYSDSTPSKSIFDVPTTWKVSKNQLGGNLVNQSKIDSINLSNPKKGDVVELDQKTTGTKFKDIGSDGMTEYDNQLLISGLLDLGSAITSFLPSTGITNAATAGLGLTSTFMREKANVEYGGKGTWDAVKDGAVSGALDLATALPGVGWLAGAGKLKKAKTFYDKFISPIGTGAMLTRGIWSAEESKVLDKVFGKNGMNISDLTIEDTRNLVSILAGIKRFSTNRGMKKFENTTKKDLNLNVSVKGKETELKLNANQVKSLKESKNQVEDFKKLAARQLKAKVDDIDFGSLTKDGISPKFGLKPWKTTEKLNFNLTNPSESVYSVGNYDNLTPWQKFVARDGMQSKSWKGKGSLWGKNNINMRQPEKVVPQAKPNEATISRESIANMPHLGTGFNLSPKTSPSKLKPNSGTTNNSSYLFKKGGVFKFAFGGLNTFKMDPVKKNFGNKTWVTNDVFVTRPENVNPGELKAPELSPFFKQESPLDKYNNPLEKPILRFEQTAQGTHEAPTSNTPKTSNNPISYADVLDFTNLIYANRQTNNLKQYTNYKPALAKAPRLATPSVSVNGIEETNARRRIAELNAAKPQYASAEQALMGKYATNAQGNEMSRQVGQSISSQLEGKKEAYRQAVNQQEMMDTDVQNRNNASIVGNHNMQLNAQGELAKTIFQNNSNYITRIAQNQRMKDMQREKVVNQKRALEYNTNPVNAQKIQEARNKVELARQAAGNDINNVAYRNAVNELESLIRMNELTTEAMRNGVTL